MDADIFSYSPFDASDPKDAVRKMVDRQREQGATFFRVTWFSDEHPDAAYPHGIYLEGWIEQPPEQGPFNFPLDKAKGETE
jgi:hypothetical protein